MQRVTADERLRGDPVVALARVLGLPAAYGPVAGEGPVSVGRVWPDGTMRAPDGRVVALVGRGWWATWHDGTRPTSIGRLWTGSMRHGVYVAARDPTALREAAFRLCGLVDRDTPVYLDAGHRDRADVLRLAGLRACVRGDVTVGAGLADVLSTAARVLASEHAEVVREGATVMTGTFCRVAAPVAAVEGIASAFGDAPVFDIVTLARGFPEPPGERTVRYLFVRGARRVGPREALAAFRPERLGVRLAGCLRAHGGRVVRDRRIVVACGAWWICGTIGTDGQAFRVAVPHEGCNPRGVRRVAGDSRFPEEGRITERPLRACSRYGMIEALPRRRRAPGGVHVRIDPGWLDPLVRSLELRLQEGNVEAAVATAALLAAPPVQEPDGTLRLLLPFVVIDRCGHVLCPWERIGAGDRVAVLDAAGRVAGYV